MISPHPGGTRENTRGDQSMAEVGDTIFGKKIPSSDQISLHYIIIQTSQTVPDQKNFLQKKEPLHLQM